MTKAAVGADPEQPAGDVAQIRGEVLADGRTRGWEVWVELLAPDAQRGVDHAEKSVRRHLQAPTRTVAQDSRMQPRSAASR